MKDGVIEDPTRCKFDPQALECKGPDGLACLTAPQVEAARKIYAPVTNPRTKKEIFPGHEPGSELGWNTMAGAQSLGTGLDLFKFVVFKDPNWDYRTLNFDSDLALIAKADSGGRRGRQPIPPTQVLLFYAVIRISILDSLGRFSIYQPLSF